MRRFLGTILGVTDERPEYPTVRLVEVSGLRSVFRVSNYTEDYRVSELGDEREQIERFLDSIDSDAVVWDVGANVGLYAIFAARMGATVHAFEPDPEFLGHFQENLDLNGQPVSVHEFALSDEDGETTLYTDGIEGMSPTLAAGRGEGRGQMRVGTRRGDSLDLPTPDVLKVDVEGAEASVLDGMSSVLDEIRTVFVELHPEMLSDFGSSVESVRATLDEHGFEPVWESRREEQIHAQYDKT